jgi:hypothetical protein
LARTAIVAVETVKLQHWRGLQAENALEAAPVLEFVLDSRNITPFALSAPKG